MNADKQRIAIAEACGWRSELWASGGWQCYDPDGERCEPGTGSRESSLLMHSANYLGDLNAMSRAEKLLSYGSRLSYPANLFDVVCRTSDSSQSQLNKIHPDSWAIFATAAQCAEAFLRTLNLWTDQ